MNYRSEDRRTFAYLRGNIGAIWYVLTPSFKTPNHHHQIRNCSAARRCNGKRAALYKPVVELPNYKPGCESPVVISLWHRSHQWWLSDIKLVQISAYQLLKPGLPPVSLLAVLHQLLWAPTDVAKEGYYLSSLRWFIHPRTYTILGAAGVNDSNFWIQAAESSSPSARSWSSIRASMFLTRDDDARPRRKRYITYL